MRTLDHGLLLGCLLATLLSLAGPASAQFSSSAQLTAEQPEPPDALPGGYETTVTVELMHPMGVCGCTETTIELSHADAPWAHDVRFEPSTLTFSWIEQRAAGQTDGQTLTATLSFHVAEAMAGKGTSKMTIEGEGETNGPEHSVRVAPTQIAVHFPADAPEPTVERGEVTADPAPKAEPREAGTGTGPGPDASTDSSDEPTENQAPAIQAGLAILALAGLALALRRS